MPADPVFIIGPGRLGRSLAVLLERANTPVQLIGRGGDLPDHGRVLLTVPDQAIAEVARRLPIGPTVLHTSGATGLAPVAHHAAYGSLHPLMSFPGPEISLPDLHDVPAAIAGDARGRAVAHGLARSLGMRAFEVPGDRRLYHAAAVLAGNGATVLLGHASRALVAAGVPSSEAVEILLPLVQRSILNASPHPAAALTGPIARGERAIVEDHLRALDEAALHDVARIHRAIADAAEALLRAAETSSDEAR